MMYGIFGESTSELNETNTERCKNRVKRIQDELGIRIRELGIGSP